MYSYFACGICGGKFHEQHTCSTLRPVEGSQTFGPPPRLDAVTELVERMKSLSWDRTEGDWSGILCDADSLARIVEVAWEWIADDLNGEAKSVAEKIRAIAEEGASTPPEMSGHMVACTPEQCAERCPYRR